MFILVVFSSLHSLPHCWHFCPYIPLLCGYPHCQSHLLFRQMRRWAWKSLIGTICWYIRTVPLTCNVYWRSRSGWWVLWVSFVYTSLIHSKDFFLDCHRPTGQIVQPLWSFTQYWIVMLKLLLLFSISKASRCSFQDWDYLLSKMRSLYGAAVFDCLPPLRSFRFQSLYLHTFRCIFPRCTILGLSPMSLFISKSLYMRWLTSCLQWFFVRLFPPSRNEDVPSLTSPSWLGTHIWHGRQVLCRRPTL